MRVFKQCPRKWRWNSKLKQEQLVDLMTCTAKDLWPHGDVRFCTTGNTDRIEVTISNTGSFSVEELIAAAQSGPPLGSGAANFIRLMTERVESVMKDTIRRILVIEEVNDMSCTRKPDNYFILDGRRIPMSPETAESLRQANSIEVPDRITIQRYNNGFVDTLGIKINDNQLLVGKDGTYRVWAQGSDIVCRLVPVSLEYLEPGQICYWSCRGIGLTRGLCLNHYGVVLKNGFVARSWKNGIQVLNTLGIANVKTWYRVLPV